MEDDWRSAFWQIFRQARPRSFRYSQDTKSARQLFQRQAAERLKNTHALDDVHSALCQFFRCVCWHGIFSRGGVTWSIFSAAAAQVTANWLKPLKFPECAACTRRVGQLELPSNKRSCMSHANFLNPTTLIS